MIKSWIAYALSTVAIIVLGFVKVKVPSYPIETVATGIVTIFVAYITKRVAPRIVSAYRNRGGLSND